MNIDKNNFTEVFARSRTWLEDTNCITRYTSDNRIIELPIGKKWKCNILDYSHAFPRSPYNLRIRVKFQKEFWNWLKTKNIKASIQLIKTEFGKRDTVFIKIHESDDSVDEIKFQIALSFL